MDCRWITAVRTGAVSAVAAKYLAKKHSSVIGIVGAGIQGRFNLLALKNVLPEIYQVKVFDISPSALEKYINQMSQVVSAQIKAVASAHDAIVGSDVIVTATGKLEKPVYMESWVKEGALVLPVHHRGWENALLRKSDKFVCDDWLQLQQADREVGGFDGPLPALYGELGEIVLGRKAGRQSDQERIVDVNYGLAIADVAIGKAILEKARLRKMGLALTLCKGDLPLQ
jgi:ornithine cyclodeaminase/alanine dehydrogenase